MLLLGHDRTSNRNHRTIHIFNIIEILNKYKIFEYHQFQNFSNIIDLRKLDFLSGEKISEHYSFVNKDIMQSWFKKLISMIVPILKIFTFFLCKNVRIPPKHCLPNILYNVLLGFFVDVDWVRVPCHFMVGEHSLSLSLCHYFLFLFFSLTVELE